MPQKGSDQKDTAKTPRKSSFAVWIGLFLVLLLIGIAATTWLQHLAPSGPVLTMEDRIAVESLRKVTLVQARYNASFNGYATSGTALAEPGEGGLEPALAAAFVHHAGNNDPETPKPYHGYVFMMLQGNAPQNLSSFWKNKQEPKLGMGDWACIARPVAPSPQGSVQFLVVEGGFILVCQSKVGGQFLLDHRPVNDVLQETGWQPYHP